MFKCYFLKFQYFAKNKNQTNQVTNNIFHFGCGIVDFTILIVIFDFNLPNSRLYLGCLSFNLPKLLGRIGGLCYLLITLLGLFINTKAILIPLRFIIYFASLHTLIFFRCSGIASRFTPPHFSILGRMIILSKAKFDYYAALHPDLPELGFDF